MESCIYVCYDSYVAVRHGCQRTTLSSLIFLMYYVVPGIKFQLIGLRGKSLYPLSHLPGPVLCFSKVMGQTLPIAIVLLFFGLFGLFY